MDTLWKSVLGELELEPSISAANFKTWLAETELIFIDNQRATIGVKNAFHVNQLRKKYCDIIQKTLEKNGVNPKEIDFKVQTVNKTTKISREITPGALKKERAKSTRPSGSSRVDELLSGKNSRPSDNLNPRYTFDNFVVGSSNDLAYAAAKTAADLPGEKYNPLYFYGGVGLGKTHLMQAVGNEIKKKHPEMSVLYITIETFYKDYLESVRFKKQGYADKYRAVDVLIVDDMQFIAGKEKSQEEFFHTFNELHQSNKQIIISSDRPPKSIPTLTDRLRSRFEWGMAIDIQMPDFETRQAIIETKAELSGFKLDQETTNFLASNIRTNIRELEGTLNQLLAIAEMRGVQPDAEMAEGMISETIRTNRPQHLTYKKIIDKASKFYQIPKDDLLGRSRTKDINRARQVSCYLMKYELKMSFPQIGAVFGRDHSTIINGVTNIEKSLKLDLAMREQINALVESIYE
ncbi:chromosomal replication initiator protein DnaA [Candidatus Saccharibacteria bacterium]|jgi:chromosomal replication initiator protein|nr:chromosomal replication initiator protein DnaA [Candidatus Saccharibacteria bacterium]